MSEEEIYLKIAPIFRDVFGDESITPRADMTAAEVDDWDSLGHIRLVVAVEEHFGIKFGAYEINSWPNVGAFVRSINQHLTAHAK